MAVSRWSRRLRGSLVRRSIAAKTRQQPVISVDTKKKELLGNFKNGGTDYRPKGDPRRMNVHDFEDKKLCKVVPYGVHDVAANDGGAWTCGDTPGKRARKRFLGPSARHGLWKWSKSITRGPTSLWSTRKPGSRSAGQVALGIAHEERACVSPLVLVLGRGQRMTAIIQDIVSAFFVLVLGYFSGKQCMFTQDQGKRRDRLARRAYSILLAPVWFAVLRHTAIAPIRFRQAASRFERDGFGRAPLSVCRRYGPASLAHRQPAPAQ